ncbi:MAG: hypothetical protein Q9M89_08480 [Persephonella sp.]|nr:hypothetical protein [Persephonella sp.]
MFTPAGDGHPAVKNSDLPKTEAGFLKIESTCQAVGIDNIYGVGDSCSIKKVLHGEQNRDTLLRLWEELLAHNIAVKEGLKIWSVRNLHRPYKHYVSYGYRKWRSFSIQK